ncbi:hypothetical protein IIY24_02925 [Candidatus Saccharibacteria bacterium]|nr:hypothetical protein [Candidatus Saccharibacteria bacterium]
MNNDEKVFFAFLVGLIGIVLLLWNRSCTSYTVPEYEAEPVPARIIRFTFEANVRNDPGVLDVEEGPTNYCGTLGESGFTMELASQTLLVQRDVFNDANGDFYGFSVEDILNTPEGDEWFPDSIEDDEDGVVWVNAQYVEIVVTP